MDDADTVPEKSVSEGPAFIETEDGGCVGSEPGLTLDALPETVLVQLCAYVVDDGDYDALDAFRKTCSATASAVNSYLQTPSNLPKFLPHIKDSGRTTHLWAYFDKSSLLLHPIRYLGGFIGPDTSLRGQRGYSDTCTISRNLKSRESIETAAQMVLGSYSNGPFSFEIRCGRNSDFSRVALLLSQFTTIPKLQVNIKQLNDNTATNILEFVRTHGVKKLNMKFHSWNLSDPHRFILDISSLLNSFHLDGVKPPGPSMLDIDLDWWKTYLIDRIRSDNGVWMHYRDDDEDRIGQGECFLDEDDFRWVTGLRGISWWKQT